MEHRHLSTDVAGIDVGKRWLDVALPGSGVVRVSNDAAGIAGLCTLLRETGVSRVGMEASGPYGERARRTLEAEGFEVLVHQPAEVKLFGRLLRQRAKNDQLDAGLIAAATAVLERKVAPRDPRLVELAQRLTVYEQISQSIVGLKTLLESVELDDLRTAVLAQIASLLALKRDIARHVLDRISAHADLKAGYQLLRSLPGFGPVVAMTMLVRVPELGDMQHGQPASLIGVAPHDRDSGQHRGKRFIAGGRERPRRMLYIAALAAKRSDPTFKAFAARLEANGKPPKLILVAIMRKLAEAANLVIKRQTPWHKTPN